MLRNEVPDGCLVAAARAHCAALGLRGLPFLRVLVFAVRVVRWRSHLGCLRLGLEEAEGVFPGNLQFVRLALDRRIDRGCRGGPKKHYPAQPHVSGAVLHRALLVWSAAATGRLRRILVHAAWPSGVTKRGTLVTEHVLLSLPSQNRVFWRGSVPGSGRGAAGCARNAPNVPRSLLYGKRAAAFVEAVVAAGWRGTVYYRAEGAGDGRSFSHRCREFLRNRIMR